MTSYEEGETFYRTHHDIQSKWTRQGKFLKETQKRRKLFFLSTGGKLRYRGGGTQSHSEKPWQALPWLASDQRPGAKSISGTILIDSEAEESTLWAVKGKGLW